MPSYPASALASNPPHMPVTPRSVPVLRLNNKMGDRASGPARPGSLRNTGHLATADSTPGVTL
jgi:hypothetical protein